MDGLNGGKEIYQNIEKKGRKEEEEKNEMVILRTDAYERSDEKIVKNLRSEGLII